MIFFNMIFLIEEIQSIVHVGQAEWAEAQRLALSYAYEMLSLNKQSTNNEFVYRMMYGLRPENQRVSVGLTQAHSK